MAIVKMKKLRLLAIKTQRDELLRRLQLLGCVQVSEPEKADEQVNLSRESGDVAGRREEHRELSNALALLDRYASVKDGMFAQRPEAPCATIMDSSGRGEQLALARKIIELDESIKRIAAREMDKQNAIDALQPWLSMELPLDYRGTKNTGALFGSVPAAVELNAMKSELAEKCPCSALYEISSDREQHYVLVLFHESERAELTELLRSFWFSAMALTGTPGTARENADRAKAELKSLKEERERQAGAIAAEKPNRDTLKLAIDSAAADIARAEAAEKLLSTRSTVVLEGWIPAGAEAKLEGELKDFDCAWETEEPDPEKPEEVPVKLRSNPLTEPMNVLTEMYSLPAYNGVDPNPLMLPFFPLYFGIMFADMGYGLLLVLAGLFMKLKLKPRGAMKHFSGLMLEGGIMAFIFGALTGGFFGDSLTWIAGFMGKEFALPVLIDPMNDTTAILVASLVLGMIQLLTGVLVNGWLLLRDGKKADAFWAVAPVLVIFGGLGLGVAGITWLAAIAGAVMVVYAEGRASGSIGGKIGSGLYGLYNFASGWFGDILSYSRLMALMLAGSVVAQVFNSLGAMGGPLLFAVVFLVGHGLNIALNLIGCFVHALRLQYLEYFGKFYREGGKPFSPLTIKTKYVDIKED
ncbi:MAG: V-type ATP synthase subunit I [Candidatus Heteroscillospira sp.]|jgi:V/A-type H+-transporting ATPase subunit I